MRGNEGGVRVQVMGNERHRSGAKKEKQKKGK